MSLHVNYPPGNPTLDIPPRLPPRARSWTGEIEWYTPNNILEHVVAVIGPYLDPCSSEVAQAYASVKATRYYTIENPSLDIPWHGAVFMNPPYARGWVDLFTKKFVDEYRSGRMSAGVILVNTCADTAWFQHCLQHCTAVCHKQGRIRFVTADDRGLRPSKRSPPHGHSFLYFGPERERFRSVFSTLGWVGHGAFD